MEITLKNVEQQIKRYYIEKGYFVSGSIDVEHLGYAFGIPNEYSKFYDKKKEEEYKTKLKKIQDCCEKLCKKGIIHFRNTIGGLNVYLDGSIRVKLINDFNLLPIWIQKTKNSHNSWMYAFDKELENAKINQVSYNN